MPTLIDLTMPIHEGMPVHPVHGRTPVRLSGTLDHWEYLHQNRHSPYGGLVSFANEQWVLNGHTGTHVDSVWHVDPESALTIDRMPLERCFGPAVLLDCSAVWRPSGSLSVADLERAEQQAGGVFEHDIVVLNTGSSRASGGSASQAGHVGLSQQAAEWLRDRQIATLALDSPSPDAAADALTAPVHMNFLRPRSLGLPDEDYIAIVENLTNLDAIPAPRFTFCALPLPLAGGSASPVRAVAVID